MDRILRVPALLAVVAAATACADDGGPTAPIPDASTLLVSVSPPGGASNVPVDVPVTIEFDRPMAAGMEAYVDLHPGNLAAAPIAGTRTWSADGTRLTFVPMEPLQPATVHVLHLGGGMTDADGMPVDFAEHGEEMGGAWATGEMMNQGWSGGPGMGGGMGGPGMGVGDPYQGHMGGGWEHANGSYGMVFAFRTAG